VRSSALATIRRAKPGFAWTRSTERPAARNASSAAGRSRSTDGIAGETEEVEVPRPPLDLAAGDECRPAGEREVLGLLEAGDDRRDLLLKWAKHLCDTALTTEPSGPRLPDRGRKNELVPEVAELVSVDVVAHVVFGTFAEDLLVDACPIGPIVEVVRDRRTAPANVKRQLDWSACLRQRGLVEVFRHGDWPCCGAELGTTRVRHRSISVSG
jgi:hypothetical protein